jgi:hypothetical protein
MTWIYRIKRKKLQPIDIYGIIDFMMADAGSMKFAMANKKFALKLLNNLTNIWLIFLELDTSDSIDVAKMNKCTRTASLAHVFILMYYVQCTYTLESGSKLCYVYIRISQVSVLLLVHLLCAKKNNKLLNQRSVFGQARHRFSLQELL